MTPLRKSVPALTKAALKKCEMMYSNGLVAFCTPSEYAVLCWHFKKEVKVLYEEKIKKGISNPSWHYFKVDKFDRVYPVSNWAILDVKITGAYD